MGDSIDNGGSRFLNPWFLHFQKLGLELKCPLCLNLLAKPMLLSCNHIFCNSCIPCSAQLNSECPVCKALYFNKDLRTAPFMDNLVTIYRGLEATFCANLFQRVPSDSRRVLEQFQASLYTGNGSKEPSDIVQRDKSGSGQLIFPLLANKQDQIPLNLNSSVENGFGLNENFEKYSTPIEGKGGREGVKFNDGLGMNPPPLSSQREPESLEEQKVGEIEMNQVSQSLPDTPPSFGDTKGSDDESFYWGSVHSLENPLINRASNKHSESRTRQLRHDSSASETEDGYSRDIKRQKKLTYGPSGLRIERHGCIPPVSHSEILMIPNSELELESRVTPVAAQQPLVLDASHMSSSICAFCQSPAISKNTGPILHYANGKMVVGDEASRSNVIHVHRLCVDWAPQVYFVNDTVKNLKAEVARGLKIKCGKCGRKGAALGCYAKSCRKSYHVPCAVEMSDCRWDHENFLMLCPAHTSIKFPNEKSRSGKHVFKDNLVPNQRAPPQPILWVAPRDGAKEWVICGSALSTEEKVLVLKFASMCGATVTKYWKPNVTHVIAATDAQGACTRTLKVLMAILNGRWILKIGWVKACMEAMHPVDEEPYEVDLDNHGSCNGPKTGRLMGLDNAPKLFNGLKFYFVGDFVPGYMEDLQNLVTTAGGTVLKSKEEVVAQSCDDQVVLSRILVVYNLDSPQGCKVGEEVDILWKRLTEAQDVAADLGCQVIGHTWLLESIAACNLQPLVN
ncbi:hypothetical protein I3843_03G251200 [Carya illinoinensis]|nr:hypothetical protein I3843_03G251200 [Carya illinoinensis]